MADQELATRWAEAFRATVAESADEEARSIEQDLFAEHQLRRIEPPYDLVAADRNLLIAQVTAKLKELDRSELEALKNGRLSGLDRNACKARLERAKRAVVNGQARVAKQRAILQALSRRGATERQIARQVLRELERSVMRAEQTRRYYALLLKRWS